MEHSFNKNTMPITFHSPVNYNTKTKTAANSRLNEYD